MDAFCSDYKFFSAAHACVRNFLLFERVLERVWERAKERPLVAAAAADVAAWSY